MHRLLLGGLGISGLCLLLVTGCSGTTDSGSPPSTGGAGSGGGGSGGTQSPTDGGWVGGAGGGGGTAGASGGPSGGGTGATGGASGGSGGSSGTGATGGGGSGGSGGVGGSGGSCGTEICNNKDDDCDGQIDEGLTQACSTSCGSGTQTCSAGVWSACSAIQPQSCKNYSTCANEQVCVVSCPAAPSEVCNLKDDNCDGNCDDFASCRQGVHRSQGNGEHFYTTNLTEAQCCGYTLESQNFFYLYKAQTGSLVAFYRCLLANGKHFYTKSSNCEGSAGATVEGIIGYIASSTTCGAVPLYRTSKSGEHFYTTSLAEKNNAVQSLGYTDEGIAGYVWTAP
jgi:hypothetical protein